jgi:hypothetical protein
MFWLRFEKRLVPAARRPTTTAARSRARGSDDSDDGDASESDAQG